MAESVDALVSNTSRFTPVPVRPRLWVLKTLVEQLLRGFLLFNTSKMVTFGHLLHCGAHLLSICLRKTNALSRMWRLERENHLGWFD